MLKLMGKKIINFAHKNCVYYFDLLSYYSMKTFAMQLVRVAVMLAYRDHT